MPDQFDAWCAANDAWRAAKRPLCDYCKQPPDAYVEVGLPNGRWLHVACAVDCELTTIAEMVDHARCYGHYSPRLWDLPPGWRQGG
jgi:hypothetical protein